ncbi:MAG: 23S rRNA (guanosine(2251)-2'-O)-methyltransferase RlmB [Myxococcota bacterium]
MEVLAGLQSVREALVAGRRRAVQLWIRTPPPRGAEALASLAEAAGVPVEWGPHSDLEGRVPGEVRSQGVLLQAEPLPELGLQDARGLAEQGPALFVALDEVEDPQNVGAVARAAEGAGATALILTRRRAPRLTAAVSRASAGAIEHLPVVRVPNLARSLRELHELGCWRLGGDAGSEATPLYESPDALWTEPLVLVLGGEERGLRPAVVRELDLRLRIPMRGRVASLNVATAAAVLLFEAVRRRTKG